MLSIIWSIVFPTQSLETDRMLEAHIDMILSAIKIDHEQVAAT
jgi:hypothetical protein